MHYDTYQQEEDHITGLKDIQSTDIVQQCLCTCWITRRRLLQAAAQFLLDDWTPDSPEWYDESTGTWHYDPYQQEEDHITGLKDVQGTDIVQQCLSDAQGVLPAHLCCLSIYKMFYTWAVGSPPTAFSMLESGE